MADTKLTNLPAATPLENSDSLYVVQGGVSKKISATALFATHVADHDAHGALEDADIPASIARDSEVTAAINAHNILNTAHGVASGFWAAAAGTGPLTVGTAGATAGKLILSAALPNDSPFTMFTEHYPFNGTEETTFNIGYNMFGELENTYRFWMGMESNYRATATDYYSEWYIALDNATQTKNIRALQTSINNQTLEAQNFYSAETHYFCGSDGLSENFISFINGAPPSMSLNGNTEIIHNTNNAVMIRQRATNGQAIQLIYLNNNNYISIGQQGYSIAPQGDIDFHLGNFNASVVIYDATDHHAYRIKVTGGGNLTTEFVR